ncbi:MAG: endonuclease III [Chloroflexi bacterium]|nr:endonuclease III [Chloroflexota bacterium]
MAARATSKPKRRSASTKRNSARQRTLTPTRVIELLDGEYGTLPWRPAGDPIAELVLTLLSQNTSDSNSGRAFIRLLSEFPDYESLLDADVKRIEKAIQPGGLAPTKAPRMQEMLREVWNRRGSFDLTFLKDMPLDEARAWLRSLPGVGPKTAACVLLFALGMPALPVDTHVHRVAKRLGLVPEKSTPEQAFELLEPMLEPKQVYPFHIQLIKHGRRTCSARKPKCGECPLASECPSAEIGQS